MIKREIEISRKEDSYCTYREYAIVYDNDTVEFRSNSHINGTTNEADNPKSRFTVEQLKSIVQQLT